MTSIINSSNANSALVQTIEASDSRRNPNVYNVKEVNPTYANTWVKNDPVNGSNTANGVQNWNLQKYGIIQQILLTYEKTYMTTNSGANATAGLKIEAGDVFNTVNKVELLSSSRVVAILTAADLMAQFSNLTSSEYGPIYRTATGPREDDSVNPTAAATASYHTWVLPLHFGFMDDTNLNLNSSFLEGLSIRVTWGSDIGNHTYTFAAGAAVTGPTTVNEPHLRILYKSMPEQPTAEMLSENFSADSLIQVSSRFYDENPVYYEGGAVAVKNHKVDVDLKNTDCVESFYVVIRAADRTKDAGTGNLNGGYGRPVQVNKVEFTGSGQEILTLEEMQIPYTRLQDNGWATSSGVADFALQAGTSELWNICKLQNGLYDSGGGGKLSNTMSLREINAGRISVYFNAAANTRYRVDVVENTTAVYQIASNTGRLSLALSN